VSDRPALAPAMRAGRDFVHWSEPRDIIVPGQEGFDSSRRYSMGGFRYGKDWLGN